MYCLQCCHSRVVRHIAGIQVPDFSGPWDEAVPEVASLESAQILYLDFVIEVNYNTGAHRRVYQDDGVEYPAYHIGVKE